MSFCEINEITLSLIKRPPNKDTFAAPTNDPNYHARIDSQPDQTWASLSGVGDEQGIINWAVTMMVLQVNLSPQKKQQLVVYAIGN